MTTRPIIVELQLEVLAFALRVLPTSQNVSAREQLGASDDLLVGRRIGNRRYGFACAFVINIAFQGEAVSFIGREVHPAAALQSSPAIVIVSVRVVFGASDKAHTIDAVIECSAVAASVSRIQKSLIDVSAACIHQCSVRVLSAFGDDVDDPVKSVRTPNCGAWSADHFDPLDILQQNVLYLPISSCKQGGVNSPSVNEHQHISR